MPSAKKSSGVPRRSSARGKLPKKQRVVAGGKTRPQSDSLHGRAYSLIKERIIKLTYLPGTYINEAQVSSDLGIGRTPVHMAVNRLALENMLEIVPRKGVIVKPMSVDDMQSVLEARLINEPAAARLAATRATEADFHLMHKIVSDGRALKNPSTEQLLSIDREFHFAMAQATKNPVLAQLLRALHDRSLRHWYVMYHYLSHGAGNTVHEHAAMIEALMARDADKAGTLMRAHIEDPSKVFSRVMNPISTAAKSGLKPAD